MTSDKTLLSKQKKTIHVLATEVATDTISLKNRKYLDGIEATQIAGEKAFHKAGITPHDIQIAELHDCFSIAELFAMEDLGFWKKGTAESEFLCLRPCSTQEAISLQTRPED